MFITKLLRRAGSWEDWYSIAEVLITKAEKSLIRYGIVDFMLLSNVVLSGENPAISLWSENILLIRIEHRS